MTEVENVPTPPDETPKPWLSDKIYNYLKILSLVILPAAGTLYFTLSGIWGLPAGEQVIGTITAVDLFFGAILGLSTASYNKSDAKFDGSAQVVTKEDATQSLVLNVAPADLVTKDQLLLKVNPQQ